MNEQSFMKSLFHGVIAEELIFPYPEMSRDERDNTTMILDSVRKFIEANVDSAKIDREQVIPDSVINGMKELGLFGMIIPQEHGGIGLSSTSYARIVQEVASYESSLAVTLGAHQSIGLKGILLFGTDAQKAEYLPKLASGEHVAAFALTEPSAGSDAAAIQTRAEPLPDGSYVLNGSKIWITNGGFADVFTVFARTSPPEGGKPETMPTRLDKVVRFLTDEKVNFVGRILDTNPLTAYRMGGFLDEDYRIIDAGKWWPRNQWEKRKAHNAGEAKNSEDIPMGFDYAPNLLAEWLQYDPRKEAENPTATLSEADQRKGDELAGGKNS